MRIHSVQELLHLHRHIGSSHMAAWTPSASHVTRWGLHMLTGRPSSGDGINHMAIHLLLPELIILCTSLGLRVDGDHTKLPGEHSVSMPCLPFRLCLAAKTCSAEQQSSTRLTLRRHAQVTGC